MRVRDVMNPEVVVCGPEDSVADALDLMRTHRLRHLPVVEGEGALGRVTMSDLLKVRFEQAEMAAEDMRRYIFGVGYTRAGWPFARLGRHLQANRRRVRRQEFRQFRYINRDWIAYPARPYRSLYLHSLFNDIAQDQKSYRPNTYPNSQPLRMSFL